MSVSLGAFDDFVFSRNPVELVLTSNNRVSTDGVKWKRRITWINGPTGTGVHLTLTLFDQVVDMQSATTPDDSGLQYRAKDAETLDEWIEFFQEDIESNDIIRSRYNITSGSSYTEFEAKETGVDWAITFTDIPGTVTTDYTLGSETVGVDRVYADNYRVLLELHSNVADAILMECLLQSDNYTGAAYDDSTYTARIEEILHALCSSPLPSVTSTEVIELTDKQLIYYFLKFWEFYGDPGIAKRVYTSNDKWAQWGGIHKLNFPGNTFFSDYEDAIVFLTYQERTKYVTTDQAEYLYFMYTTGGGSAGEIILTITYDDETTEEFTFAYDADLAPKTFYFTAGYFQIVEPNADPDKTVVSWTIEIDPDDEEAEPFTTGETFTYILRDKIPVYTRFLLFRNSYGCYDTVECTGEMISGLDVTGEILNKYLDADYVRSAGEFENTETDAQETFFINTGLRDKNTVLDYLRELMITNALYFVEQDAETTGVLLHPLVVKIESVRIKQDNDQADKFFLQFEARSAYKFIAAETVVE